VKGFQLQLFGYAMMTGGYAAGLRMKGEDWTGIPWWGDTLIAVGLLILFVVTGLCESRKRPLSGPRTSVRVANTATA
jgi:hypothetical protein